MKRIILLLIAVFSCSSIFATVVEKKYNKSFNKGSINELYIHNSYGSISIEQVRGNKIEFNVVVTARARNNVKAQELLNSVDFYNRLHTNSLECGTSFVKKGGMIKKIFGSKITIDYIVKVPYGIGLKVINEEGDVLMGDFTGKLNLTVDSGALTLGNVKGNNECYVFIKSGSFRIGDVKYLTCDLKSVMLSIKSCNRLKMNSSSTSGIIRNVNDADLMTNGGEIRIEKVKELKIVSSTSKIIVKELGDMLNCKLKKSKLYVNSIHYNFDAIDINSRYAIVELNFMKNCGFNLNLSYNSLSKLKLPNNINLVKRSNVVNPKVKSGFVGNKKFNANVNISSLNSVITIEQVQ
ncbi:MAG: hypothetical protein WCR33_05820 [Bacilli bacterium]